ncbi:MAG: hypothetical protein HUJ80_02945 [Firmicutes bacterium]|nr:hypothetical protein [Bacillota bacterium]
MKNRLAQVLDDLDKEDQKQDGFEDETPQEPHPPLTPEEQARADKESDQAVLKELKHMAVGCVICSALTVAVFFALGRLSSGVITGAVLGSAFALLNFAYLGRSVQASLSMGEQGPLYLRRTYNTRVLLSCAWVVFAVKVPFIDAIAGVLPLFYPRITIFGMQLLGMYKPSK